MNRKDNDITCQNESEELGAGDKVLEQIGVLNEATGDLKEESETTSSRPCRPSEMM